MHRAPFSPTLPSEAASRSEPDDFEATPVGPTAEERLHLGWLVRGPIRGESGTVLSWFNPNHSGFSSLDATGLLLSAHVELLRRDSVETSLRREVLADAAILSQGLAAALDDEGVVLHRGVRYALDTAITTAALDRVAEMNPCLDARSDEQRLGAPMFLRRCILEGRGQVGATEGSSRAKWSLSFAPHLLKLAVGLSDPSLLRPLVSRFVAGYWRDGWFRAAPRGAASYAHAHAYALEGLVVLREAGLQVPEYVMEEGTASLLRESERPRATTDVLAQTVRLALLQGHDGPEIDRLVDRLLGRASPGGGFRYTAAVNADLNSWATVFALQALRWIRLGPEARSIA